MHYDLAQSILQSIMGHWDVSKKTEETRDIQIISEIKYDDYQQYTHGMRYVESLALWLRQFKNQEDRDLAYNMIKENLVYVSQEEMRQLISCTYPMKVQKYIWEKTRWFCERNKIINSEERKRIYSYFCRCSLFLGLSDGAHMDFFRRQNKELSNEQVFIHYDYSVEKENEMSKDLEEDFLIKEMVKKYPSQLKSDFSAIYLIDDFAGSGKSYIRFEEGEWHGKLVRFLKRIKTGSAYSSNCDIHIILYIATEKALNSIKKQVDQYADGHSISCITVDAIQMVEEINWRENSKLFDLLKRNYEDHINNGGTSFEDVHYKRGEGKNPFLGFADCSLALVLDHNTPNNSLPVIWYSWEDKEYALFPRVTRHKEY